MLREKGNKATISEENSTQQFLNLQLAGCVIAHKTANLSMFWLPNNRLARISLIKGKYMNQIGRGLIHAD